MLPSEKVSLVIPRHGTFVATTEQLTLLEGWTKEQLAQRMFEIYSGTYTKEDLLQYPRAVLEIMIADCYPQSDWGNR